MKAVLAVAASVLLAACGTSPDEQYARDWWMDIPPSEQEDVCLAYDLFGKDLVDSLVDEYAEVDAGQADAIKALLAAECGQ